MSKPIDLSLQRFGKWIVIDRDYSKKGKETYWICVCDCGNVKSVESYALRNGRSKSCGMCKKDFIIVNDNIIPSVTKYFDESKFYLGELCINNHNYKNTGKSLRWKKEIAQKHRCVECQREYYREYYRKNREMRLAKDKEYRDKNREVRSAKSKEYYRKNREAVLAYQKQYRDKNREVLSAYHKEKYRKNREAVLAQQKEYRDKNREAILARAKKYRDKNREVISACKKEWHRKNRDVIRRKKKQYAAKNREVISAYKKEYHKNKNKKDHDYQVAFANLITQLS